MKKNPALEGLCPYGEAIDLLDAKSAMTAFRSKSLMKSADATADNYASKSPEGELQVCEFLDGLVSQLDGDEHRKRRQLLNSLVRPDSLDHIRDEIILPALRRSLEHVTEERSDGLRSGDMTKILSRTFIEFSARLVGLIGIDSSESISELSGWVHPMTSALQSQFSSDRAAVLERGLNARKLYVEKYFEPTYAHYKSLIAQVERGEISESDVPNTLMKLIVTKANPDYADYEVAVRESTLMFVAAAATGSQSIMWTIKLVHEWVAKQPDRIEHLSELEFWSLALQEALRLKAPFVEFSARIAIEDTEVEGVDVKRGQEVRIHQPRNSRDKETFGADAEVFNPLRELPRNVAQYGFGFANGPHQCLGLRIVIGNNGRSGAHAHVLKRLFELGIELDPDTETQNHPRWSSELALDDLTTFASFPVIFNNWAALDNLEKAQ